MFVTRLDDMRVCYNWVKKMHNEPPLTDDQGLTNLYMRILIVTNYAVKLFSFMLHGTIFIVGPTQRFISYREPAALLGLQFRIVGLEGDDWLSVFINLVHQVPLAILSTYSLIEFCMCLLTFIMTVILRIKDIQRFIEERKENLSDEEHKIWVKTVADATEELSE